MQQVFEVTAGWHYGLPALQDVLVENGFPLPAHVPRTGVVLSFANDQYTFNYNIVFFIYLYLCDYYNYIIMVV